LLRRVLSALVTLWAAVTLAFFALRIVGGDPTHSLLAQGLASPEQVAAQVWDRQSQNRLLKPKAGVSVLKTF